MGSVSGLRMLLGTFAAFVVFSVGSSPAVAATRAYVTNEASDTVSVIDTATNTVTATITVGDAPQGVAVSPNGSRAYVTNFGSDTVSVINTATNTVSATITVGNGPVGVAVSPDGSRAYVTNAISNTVSVINTATNTVAATITVGGLPQGVAVSPAGTRAYVANGGSSTVSVINTATNTVSATIALGVAPRGVAVSPDNSTVYVTSPVADTVSVIDTASNTVIATITVGDNPQGVAVSPDGTRAYVTNFGSDTVSVINTATNTVAATIAGNDPRGVAVSPDNSTVYVANSGSGKVSVIGTATNTVIATITVGSGPFGVVVADVDTTPPAPPAVTASDPVSPANDNSPEVRGTAEAGSTVRLYTDAACTGLSVASGSAAVFASAGLTVTVASDSSTTFYATATDAAANESACSASGLTYVEDSTPPAAPVLTDSDPDSPANDMSPRIKGTAEAGSTVQLFTNAMCTGSSVASGSAAAFASPGLVVNVADNSSTTFYATATDAAGNESACSASGLTYVEDSTPPAAPVLTDSDPDSPANDNSPEVKGTAEALSTVRLYTNAACMAPSVASGSAATFASAGLTVTVASDSSTTFYATATDAAGNVSACSSGLPYVEDSSPPNTIIDTGPAEGSTTTITTATFTFHATETGSTFGCKLDTGPVEACNAGTKTYTDLTHGSHTFSVVATDPAGNPDPSAATRTWTINTPPVASDDAYGVIGGGTLTVGPPGVLGNDTDADNDALTAQLVTTTTKGTLTLNANGSLTYTPGEDATGSDTFTYRAFDGLATSNLATVTITITAGCDGVRATRVGTPGSDTLTGTGGNDVIAGLGGNDTIDAGSGNDRVCGGSGNDSLELGSGNDRGFGGAGTDSLRGGSGDDLLSGGEGNDLLDGGGDRDALFGDGGVDRLFGGGDPDTLDGGDGSPDLCDGEGGNDTATAACEQRNDI
jgi:YVTN family beta-propeller protein